MSIIIMPLYTHTYSCAKLVLKNTMLLLVLVTMFAAIAELKPSVEKEMLVSTQAGRERTLRGEHRITADGLHPNDDGHHMKQKTKLAEIERQSFSSNKNKFVPPSETKLKRTVVQTDHQIEPKKPPHHERSIERGIAVEREMLKKISEDIEDAAMLDTLLSRMEPRVHLFGRQLRQSLARIQLHIQTLRLRAGLDSQLLGQLLTGPGPKIGNTRK